MAQTQLGGEPLVTAGSRPSPNGSGRRIDRRPGLPGGRAALGGLLVTIAAVGTYAVATRGGDGRSPIVVAADDLRSGEVLEAADLDVRRGVLPSGSEAFATVEELVGHVVLGPVAAGEILQPAAVSPDARTGASRREIALTLPSEQVAVGRLRAGDRVDVFVTYEDATSSIVEGAEVVQIVLGDGNAIARRGQISLVVAVESPERVAALVHALRTGEVTVVRSTLADESADGTTFEPSTSTTAER